MNQGIFWGILIIIFGIVLLVKQLFNLEIPVFRMMIGVFLVMLGIRLLFFNNFKTFHHSDGDVVFGSKEMHFNPEITKYDCVFGSMNIDMTNLDKSPGQKYELNAVFGEITVLVNSRTHIKLKSDVVLGSVEIPSDRKSFGFEDQIDSTNINIEIKAAAVFGSIKFMTR